MGELQMLIDPGLGVFRQQPDVQFARRQHHLRIASVDVVAIDVDIDEIVVKANLLQLLVGIDERARVPEPDVAAASASSFSSEARVSVPFPANGFTSTLSSLYAARVIAIFAVEVGLLDAQFVGLDPQPLDDGFDEAQQQRGAEHHHKCDHRQAHTVRPTFAKHSAAATIESATSTHSPGCHST